LDSFSISNAKYYHFENGENWGKPRKHQRKLQEQYTRNFTIYYITWKENEVKNTLSKGNLTGSKIRNFSFKVGGSSIWF
jgi:hypothetical protein